MSFKNGNSKRESLIRELDVLTQPISVDDDIENEDLENYSEFDLEWKCP